VLPDLFTVIFYNFLYSFIKTWTHLILCIICLHISMDIYNALYFNVIEIKLVLIYVLESTAEKIS
jgi:hypothetical protein